MHVSCASATNTGGLVAREQHLAAAAQAMRMRALRTGSRAQRHAYAAGWLSGGCVDVFLLPGSATRLFEERRASFTAIRSAWRCCTSVVIAAFSFHMKPIITLDQSKNNTQAHCHITILRFKIVGKSDLGAMPGALSPPEDAGGGRGRRCGTAAFSRIL